VLDPALAGLAALAAWEAVVRMEGIPAYILPGPILVARTLVADWGTLFPSLLVTLAITGAAFLVAAVLGLALAVVFTQSTFIERSFSPYAVILQVTPTVAIAPLIILWVKWIPLALLICAWLVAFFPVLSYTLQIPRMFAALFLISAAGVLIFAFLTGLSRLALRRWHESELDPAD